MAKVKLLLLKAVTEASKPEFRPIEVRLGRALMGVVVAWLGYKGYKVS